MASPPSSEPCREQTGTVAGETDRWTDLVQRAQWIRAAILGANDGLLSTASLMLGVGAANDERRSMILSGLAGALAGACSMAVGEFVSVSTQRDIEKALKTDITADRDDDEKLEKMSPVIILGPDMPQGLSPIIKVMTDDVVTLVQDGDKENALPNPYKAASASALAFLCGSVVPLASAAFIEQHVIRVVVIAVASSAALLMFGCFGAYLGGSPVRDTPRPTRPCNVTRAPPRFNTSEIPQYQHIWKCRVHRRPARRKTPREWNPTGKEDTMPYGSVIVSLLVVTSLSGSWDGVNSPLYGSLTILFPRYKYVALKIQKSAEQFAQAALHEVEVLLSITDSDPSNSKCVVHLIDHFKHSGPNGQHVCIVLEFLGDSLLRLIRFRRYKGLELNRVREICKCVLIALDYLHRELDIIHTDLKPENILLFSTINPSKDPIRSALKPILERPKGGSLEGGSTMSIIEKKLKRRARQAVANLTVGRAIGREAEALKLEKSMDGIDLRCKVVDFGNACWANKPLADEIQTRQYRAPEVILGSGYSFPADMWSFACTAFELATGDMMFAPKSAQGYSEDEDHLALMMELLGKMPKKIAIGGARSKVYFDRHGDLKRIRRLKIRPLDRYLMDKYKFSENDAREFARFLCPLLDFAPEKRPTAQQCLQHPWLNLGSSQPKEMNAQTNVNDGMGNLKIN
ncbi:hypothetical protein GQ457_09G009590 [Hibiscus cannabinus]